MSEESKPLMIHFDPKVVAEFNAKVSAICAALADVPRRMADLERKRSEEWRP